MTAALLKGSFRSATLVLAISATFIAGTAVARAEKPPADLEKIRAAFAAAVAAKDLQAVEALTSFPLKIVVEGDPPTVSLTAFPKVFRQNGYADSANCLKSAPLERAETKEGGARPWRINCGGNLFYFALKNGQWRHSEYENINE